MPSSPQWVFGSFRLDPANACLWHGVETMVLSPKAFDVLHYLVTHPDRLVTKDELLDAVWSETAVTDAVLRVAIGALRKVLGDPAQTPRYIATVPRRGYRFVAPVTEHTGVEPGPAAPALPAVPQTPIGEPQGASTALLPDTLAPPPRQGVALSPGDLPLPDAERRRLTVLFCDLVDSTRLAGRLDPEDYQEIVRAYHQTCAEVIQRFDGYLAQYLGDGVLVYFGYPVAHEDDAQRAVRTGLGLLDALEPLNTRLALPPEDRVAVRLGGHTGVVVVGTVGEGARQEPLALGETPAIAARLQSLALSNTLLISAATYRLIEGYFTCEALGAQPLHGLAQSLQVYRVLGASGVQSRLEVAAARGLTPLVGREPEVAFLVERWARVKAGMGQVVVLEGEAGIGKSRLVQVLKDHVAHEVHTRLEWRGSPYHQHTALYPVTEFMHRVLHRQPGTTPGEALQQLEVFLAQSPLALDEAVPLLAGLLTLPLPEERYPPKALTPEQQRHKTLDVLLTLVEALVERQPVLVIVEDLHWVDASTLELLERLIDQVPTIRLYMVLTCRPTFQPPWGFRTYLTPLVLNRLTPPQAEEMVGQMLGGQRLPAAVLEQIVTKTDGIPLFVEELTKAVVEGGLLTTVHDQDTWCGPLPALAIPTTLHEALLARLDRLGSAKSVAQLGATIGHRFPYTLLRVVSPLEDEALQRDLAALVAAELLYQRGQPPRAVYRFKHALVQEAAYESVLRSVRRQTHQRILQVLEAQFPETVATTPELLAHHALRGERWDQAVAYFRQAGDKALTRSAYREAGAAFEQALIALQHLPDSRDTSEQAIDLRLALRTALRPLGDFGRILAYLREAETLATALDDPHRLGWVLVFLSGHFYQRGAHDQAVTASERALTLATASGDVVPQALANDRLGLIYRVQGDYRRAIDCFKKTVAALDGGLRHEGFGQTILPAVNSRAILAECYAELGMFAEGRGCGEEGLQIAEAVAHPGSLMIAYYGLGLLALRQGGLHRGLPLLERAVGICQGADLPGFFPRTAWALGAGYILDGRVADAMSLLTPAREQSITMGRAHYETLCSLPLGEAQMLGGCLVEAQALAERALALARTHQERGNEAYALRLLGAIAAQGDASERTQAEVHYLQALALAEELGMRPLAAHCQRGLGTLYSQMGQLEQARVVLSTAIALYRAMEMTFWLPQAEAALVQVGAAPAP
jgi:class 3 adenylate cyclase/DNA-binding winged helix-turn-helix (wHTH) protein/tetratricopeptide (TPR) repeat protein